MFGKNRRKTEDGRREGEGFFTSLRVYNILKMFRKGMTSSGRLAAVILLPIVIGRRISWGS